MFSQVDLIEIAQRFGLALRAIHAELDVRGSPERTSFRTVIEDDQEQLHVVQAFTRERAQRKRLVAETISFLHQAGLGAALPYHPSQSGDLIVPFREHYWQIRLYLQGEPLSRPQWCIEPWRVEPLVALLSDIRRYSTGLPERLIGKPFSIQRYVARLVDDMNQHHPHLLPRVRPIGDHLAQRLWLALANLPMAFCHSDIHPLNIIWGEQSIRALIDWEFCGLKPELYDLANLVGCAGVEDPDALCGPLVTGMIERLRARVYGSHESWTYLPELVLAIRFAWLAEWLRKEDRDMIELELVYMELLASCGGELAHGWGLSHSAMTHLADTY